MLHLFKILGFGHPVTQEEVKARYKTLAKQYHPDVNPNTGEYFKQINAAYQQLKKLGPGVFAPTPPKPKTAPRKNAPKKAEQTIFRVFNSNNSHSYAVKYVDEIIPKNTRFFFMIDGREYRTFFEDEVKLPYTMEIKEAYRDETYRFRFVFDPY